MRNKLSWLVGPGLVLLVACSAEQGAPSRSPVSIDATDFGAATSSVTASAECTLTQGYWRNHPEDWPVDEIMIGGNSYTMGAALDILSTPPRGDATYILAHQWIAATLNVAAGADPTEEVAKALADAESWLAAALDPSIEDRDRDEGIALAETLDQFNNGVTGPGHCEDDAPTPPTDPPPAS